MAPRETRLVALTLVAAILLYMSIATFGSALSWGAIIVLAVLGVAYIVGRGSGSPGILGGGFLCDGCKYNDLRYCSRPERPNATECADFKPR